MMKSNGVMVSEQLISALLSYHRFFNTIRVSQPTEKASREDESGFWGLEKNRRQMIVSC